MKKKYSSLIGLKKTIKNSLILLVPFVVAILAGAPAEHAWIVSPVVYFLKNRYEQKTGKKI
jgi:hypothetical protein